MPKTVARKIKAPPAAAQPTLYREIDKKEAIRVLRGSHSLNVFYFAASGTTPNQDGNEELYRVDAEHWLTAADEYASNPKVWQGSRTETAFWIARNSCLNDPRFSRQKSLRMWLPDWRAMGAQMAWARACGARC